MTDFAQDFVPTGNATPMTLPQRRYYQRIGQRIRNARKRRGMSQRQLATWLGVSDVAIHYWESAQHEIRAWTLHRLERLLGEELR